MIKAGTRRRTPHRVPDGGSPISATAAKNEFGRLLEQAIGGATVTITKHDVPKAVLISLAKYQALVGSPKMDLDVLTGEFDRMLTRMQTPKAQAAMKAAFGATPKQLGQAAVAAARKRG